MKREQDKWGAGIRGDLGDRFTSGDRIDWDGLDWLRVRSGPISAIGKQISFVDKLPIELTNGMARGVIGAMRNVSGQWLQTNAPYLTAAKSFII